ncbi:MAG: NAD-dependent epimerase/dehydratase family protein [Pseudonocardiales bacterium]|nr:NAD-dependent epimerase/dehydratase family protein [Pseudonocardiales bacterium]
MSLHVIVGAGAVGSATARLLAERGDQVRLISRRGTGPTDVTGVELVAADASDAQRLAELTAGASVIYNCANPPYHRWSTQWPPMAAALLTAAEASGAVLVTMSNLYGYGPVDGPMTEDLPLRPSTVKGEIRARMWRDALVAHEAGRIRAVEARASDYVGAGATSLLTSVVLPKVVAGKRALVPADLDVPHSWTYVGDVARTLAVLGADERAWGRAWHVATEPAMPIREVATLAAELTSAPAPRLARMPAAVLWLGGLTNPTVRELQKMIYQFRRPFVLDSTAVTSTFGLTATPLATSLKETVVALQASP